MIIPDGDRTYAARHGVSLDHAYRLAAERLIDVIRCGGSELGILRVVG
jgi:hypothetical protein